MCETPTGQPRTGWRGWPDLPQSDPAPPAGPWLDLTHRFSAEVPRSAMFPPPEITWFARMPEQVLNVSRLETVVHVGTHVDAPRHFFADGPGVDDIPLDRLIGEGVVVRVDKPAFGAIGPADLEAAAPAIRTGDIVVLDTGWASRWGSPDWNRHPHLSAEAAEWLIDRRVRMLAVDTATPDLAFDRREAGFGFPVHCALLGRGVLIAEQLAIPGALSGRRAEFMFCPVPIAGCDGAPARVLGRPLRG